jgi:hypothetical protein
MNVGDWIALGAAIGAIAAALTSWSQAKSSRTASAQAKRQAWAADEQVRLMRQQIQQTDDAQREQKQPYVIVDIQPMTPDVAALAFIIENIGTTVARNVRVSSTPPLESAWGQDLTDTLQEVTARTIPMLPPGRRLTFLFDDQSRMNNDSLPRVYTFTADCEGPFGPVEQMTYIADLDTWKAALIGHRATEQLEKRVKDLSKGLTKLVDAYNTVNAPRIREEQERQQQLFRERQEQRLLRRRSQGTQGQASNTSSGDQTA